MNAVSCIGWWHGFPQGALRGEPRAAGCAEAGGGEALASAEWPDLLGGLSGRGFSREVGQDPQAVLGARAELWGVRTGGRCQRSCCWQGDGAFSLWSLVNEVSFCSLGELRPEGWA